MGLPKPCMSKHLKISRYLFWRVHVLESTFWHQVEQVGDEADHLKNHLMVDQWPGLSLMTTQLLPDNKLIIWWSPFYDLGWSTNLSKERTETHVLTSSLDIKPFWSASKILQIHLFLTSLTNLTSMYLPDQYVPEWKPENLTQLHICRVSPHYSEHKQELLEKSVVSQKGNQITTKGRTSIPKSPCVGHLKVNCAIVVHVIHPKCNKVILLIFSICKKNKEKVPEHVFSEMRSIGTRVALLHQVPEYLNHYFHFIHWPVSLSFWYPTNSTKIWMIIPIGLYCI